MADKRTSVDPRYLSYDKQDVERILGSVEHIDEAPTEESDSPVSSGGVAEALKGYYADEDIELADEDAARGIVDEYPTCWAEID